MTKNNRGFSLVELMVVIGLLGGISLVVMNLTKQSTKSSSKYQFDSEIMLITNEINGILSDPNKCLTTFTNATQAASPATPVLNATPANVTNPIGIAGIPSTVRKYTLAGGPYGNGGVMIASYSLDLAAIPDPLLTINFQKKGILGTGTTPKTIKLHVEKTGPGVITLCRSISTASVDIWSHGAGTDIFYSGNVGIGTTTPSSALEIKGNILVNPLASAQVQINRDLATNVAWVLFSTNNVSDWSIGLTDTSPNYSNYNIYNNGLSLNALTILKSNNNVGIGITAPAHKLDVDGAIQGTAFYYSSDSRLKKNIQNIPNALDRTQKLHGVMFEWKDKKSAPNKLEQIGLIAQEVEKIFPEAVVTNPKTGMKSVEYGNLIAPMIEALKEQQKMILEQQEEIELIKNDLKKRRE